MPSFAVRLHRLLHGGPVDGALPEWPDRPAGRLVWLHAPAPAAAHGFGPLIAAMRVRGIADRFVISCPEPLVPMRGVIQIPPPPDTADGVRRFLAHWAPDLGIWASGGLRPVLIQMAGRAGVPLLLVEGDQPGLPMGGLWPRLLRGVTGAFGRVLVLDDAARQRHLRAGFAPRLVQVGGEMAEPSHVLPVHEGERATLSQAIGSRQVWLAAGVMPGEEEIVVAAHLRALHMTHRLLLILVPDDAERILALARRLEDEHGLVCASRLDDEEPEEETQVYLADVEELGMWYRLAPVTFLGGTVSGPGPRRHPWEAAALGSALLHGPELDTPLASAGGLSNGVLARMMQAGASRMVSRSRGLGDAVGDLLAAERAARLARAAWELVSAGGDATEAAADAAAELMVSRAAPATEGAP